jgi:uncharacterized SAM-binding protein YcdF (DUF218 family)
VFLFKKILAPFLLPFSICLEILLLGLILLWFTSRQRTGKVVLSIGVLLLALLSFSAFSDKLLGPLEYKYSPILASDPISGIKWIVVLGGGHTSDPRLPITSQLHGPSTARLVEAIRLHRILPGSKLILSGGGAFDPVPEARIMADAAIALGVDRGDLILEPASKDTKDQAGVVHKIVGKERFLLVTSASHMSRSIALFEKFGMKPIPAPTGYLVKQNQQLKPRMFFPRSNALGKAEIAFYEYLGMLWAKIRGQM